MPTPVYCSSCNKRIEHYPGYCQEHIEPYKLILLELYGIIEEELCGSCHERINGPFDWNDIRIDQFFQEGLVIQEILTPASDSDSESTVTTTIIDKYLVEESESQDNGEHSLGILGGTDQPSQEKTDEISSTSERCLDLDITGQSQEGADTSLDGEESIAKDHLNTLTNLEIEFLETSTHSEVEDLAAELAELTSPENCEGH